MTLILITIALVIGSMIPLWCGKTFFAIMPVIPIYFAIITGLQHNFITTSLNKDPRTFVKNFLGITVGALLLHLILMTLWMFTHPTQAKVFALTFCICYVVHLVYETTALAIYVRKHDKNNPVQSDK